MNTLINFNDHLYGVEKNKLEKTVNRLNDCVKLIAKSTEGKVSKLDYKVFCNYLNAQTGFKNAKMSADALDLADVYLEVKSVSELKPGTIDFILKKDNRYSVDLKQLKISYSSYLSNEAEEVYNALDKACSILKKYNPMYLQTINNNWSVNLVRLSNINNYFKQSR